MYIYIYVVMSSKHIFGLIYSLRRIAVTIDAFLLQICLSLWSGITVTEEISSRGVITGNASVGGSCHRNRLRYDSLSYR